MILCLDIGNTHVLGGVYNGGHLATKFKYATNLIGTTDQFGIFLLNILGLNKISVEAISASAICSVVPRCDYTVTRTINRYITNNCFVLKMGTKTGLKICYKNPSEVGADRIANAIGAIDSFPNKNILIIDMGTATTVCAINKKRDYLGGTILPGIKIGIESLSKHTAKLSEVDIVKSDSYIGRTTKESIQIGSYFGHLGALKEIVKGAKKELFNNDAIVIGTGGLVELYEDKNLFDFILPDLVLKGIYKAYKLSYEN